jgi:hypothetical protein
MKTFTLLAILALITAFAAPARADTEVPIDEDPMFAEMTGETGGSEGEPSADSPEALGDFEGTLEQAAERFSQSCFENLGPASACFEDYETQTCADYRNSCRKAGHYSR